MLSDPPMIDRYNIYDIILVQISEYAVSCTIFMDINLMEIVLRLKYYVQYLLV